MGFRNRPYMIHFSLGLVHYPERGICEMSIIPPIRFFELAVAAIATTILLFQQFD